MTPQRQTIFVADHPKGWGNCMSACLASILDLPISQVIDTCSEEVRSAGFWKPIYDWLRAQGLQMVTTGPNDPMLRGNYSIGIGWSPRGNFKHSVICKDGVMVFDPHPSDAGVLQITSHEIIVPIGAA
jgi:hypothetical protein